MGKKRFDAGRDFLQRASERLGRHHLPQIVRCLERLSDQQIWWRPNPASNSVGNLVLHLAGNTRQWIVSGIGGAVDVRRRPLEFSEQGPLPGSGLAALLRGTVLEACRVLARTPPASLGQPFSRQGFHMTRLRAIMSVLEHFSYHSGQIAYLTKLKTARDLGFTRLPPEKHPALARHTARPGKRRR